jgi:hypothetical protein
MFIIKEGVLGATRVYYYGGSFVSSTCLFLRREFWEQHMFIITEGVLGAHVFNIKEGVLGAAHVYYYGGSFGSSTCLLLRREFWEQHVFITDRVLGAALVHFGESFGSSMCLLLRREFWSTRLLRRELGEARFHYGGSLRAARVYNTGSFRSRMGLLRRDLWEQHKLIK